MSLLRTICLKTRQQVLEVARETVGERVSFSASGYFESDSVKSICAGVEETSNNQFGIKFSLVSWNEGEFVHQLYIRFAGWFI